MKYVVAAVEIDEALFLNDRVVFFKYRCLSTVILVISVFNNYASTN